jgi:hypothetical protein
VSDTARTGITIGLLQPRKSDDGAFLHPFLWHDGYQRLSDAALPPALEVAVISAVDAASEAISSVPPSRLDAAVGPCKEALAALGHAQRSIDASPAEDYSEQVSHQIGYFRAMCVYNIAMARFSVALRDDFLTVESRAVQQLGQAAALLEALERAPFAAAAGATSHDVTPDNLRVRALLAAATAIELRVTWLAKDAASQMEALATSCHKASLLYRHVAVVSESSTCVVNGPAVANFAHIKRLYYEGLCLFVLSMQPGTTKGDSRRRRAHAAFVASLEWVLQRQPGTRKQLEEEIQFMGHQCINFAKLQRKNHITLGNPSDAGGRHSDGAATVGADVALVLADGDQELIDATMLSARDTVVVGELQIASAEPSTPVTHTLTLKTRTNHRNLLLGKYGLGKASSKIPFHFVDSVVTIAPIVDDVPAPPRAPVALALIVDLNSTEMPDAPTLREMVFFAVRSAALADGDKIGLATHDRLKAGTEPAPKVAWFTVGEPTSWDALHHAISSLQPAGRFPGSRGTSIVPLIAECQSQLDVMPEHFFKHVVAITDHTDATADSMNADVSVYTKLRSVEASPGNSDTPATKSADAWRYQVPVHTFSIGSVAQAVLLNDIARRTHGNAGTLLRDGNEDEIRVARVTTFRSWIVAILTVATSAVARNVTLRVDAGPHTFIQHAALAPCAASKAPTSVTDPNRVKSVDLHVPDFTLGHTTYAAVCVAVPSDACAADIIALASVVLTYTDPTGRVRELRGRFVNRSCLEIADREQYPWLRQVRLAAVRGHVLLNYPGDPQPRAAQGSEALYDQDSVSTEPPADMLDDLEASGRSANPKESMHLLEQRLPAAVLTAPEGLQIEVQPMSRIGLKHISVNHVAFELVKGSIAVATADYGTASVTVTGQYTFVIAAGSFVRISYDAPAELIHLRVVRGVVTTELKGAAARGLEEGATAVRIDAPKQTTIRVGEALASPWALAEDGLDGFTPLSWRTAERLDDLAVLDVERIRGTVVHCLQLLAYRILRKNRIGTLAQKKASRRCRKFIVMHSVNVAKAVLSNSFAYAVGHGGVDEVKRLLDIAANISSPLVEHKRTWAAMLTVADVGIAALWRRPFGITSAFATAQHTAHMHNLLNARDRAAAEREAAATARLREAADAERRRRQALAARSFSVWDFARRGAVSCADINSVLYTLDSRRKPLIQAALSNWEQVYSLVQARDASSGAARSFPLSRSFTMEQLVAIVCFIGQHLEPAEFNAFTDGIASTVLATASAIEEDRLSRSGFNLFNRLDTTQKGYIPWGSRAVDVLRYTFGDGQEAFARIERFTQSALDALRLVTPVEKGSRPTSSMTHYAANETTALELDDGPAVTLDTLENEKITPWVFLAALRGFFEGIPEARANRELAMLCEHALHHTRFPTNIGHVLGRERKEAERRHLVEWDVPHVFDGVSDKDIRAVIDPQWQAPAHIQSLAAPICLLSGLVTLPKVDEPTEPPKALNYWQALRNVLKRDARAFFKFLKDFPPLSVTHWQAQVVGGALDEKGFEESQLLKISPVLSALCTWTRYILRIAYLEHDWETRPPMSEEIVSLIQAQHNAMDSLRRPDALVDAPPVETVIVPVAAPKYTREFRPLYQPAARSESELATTSRYSPAVASPRRPASAISNNSASLRRPQSAAVYGSTFQQAALPPTPTKGPAATSETPKAAAAAAPLTPNRPSTARGPLTARPASASKRSEPAATAWHENSWEEPTGLNPDEY